MRALRLIPFVLIFAGAATRGAAAVPPNDADAQFFETRIRPLLAERCYSCHSAAAKKLKADLYVDSLAGLLKGGESGPALVPGHPEQSRLVEAVRYANPDLQMPPKGRLSATQVSDLDEWVKRGAPWPGDPAKAAAAPAPKAPAFDLPKRKAEHWAWQPIQSAPPPEVRDADWPKAAIDRFVLAKLEAKGLKPAPGADRPALIRRAYFDLVGLPPTPAEVRAFADDPAPDAFASVVDRLLASQHFGERWARHWLDLVRYAETRGHEFDPPIPNAWQYRDYVVRALNSDVPYDQFVTEHLAGDLLEHPRLTPDGRGNESVLGTGFWFLGEEVHSPVDIRQDEADRMNNRVDTMTKAFLGLTVGCARCHDHKFDAISTKDYYALTGLLLSSAYRQVPFEAMEENRRVAGQLAELRAARRPALLKLAGGVIRPGVERTAAYLLAARRAAVGEEGAPSEPGQAESKQAEAWVAELNAARRDTQHPLHGFAKVALNEEAGQSEGFERLLRALRERAQKPAARAGSAAPERVIVDYTRPGAPWWEDGFTFGLAPARAGELESGGAGEPTLGLVAFSAARRDPAWPAIRDGSAEHDAGALGEFGRPGRTFRTPKVTLGSGSVWYLVRGAGSAYAAVDSHLLIEGPLHGALLTHFKTDDRRWRWVRHDLTNYAGQRAQIEFTPAGDSPLAVAKVVESDRRPDEPEAGDPLTQAVVSDESIHSLEGLAGAYQSLLLDGCRDLSADRIFGSPDADGRAPLAGWLLRHADLFAPADSPGRQQLDQAVRDACDAQAALVKQVTTASHAAPAMLDGNGVDENVLVRGSAHNPGDLVPRRFLEALGGSAPYSSDSSGRLRLARDLLSPDDPFPARVMVNRVWQHLFGTGIVATVDNFGVLGQPPSHPELLDYLAATFRDEQHWSVKKLIRSIVLSSAYQMSSRVGDAAAEQADPQDLLLHRMPVRRLEAEAIRDAILAVSGRLDVKVGGPSVDVYLTPFMEGRGRPSGGPLDGAGRRSLYVKVRRNFLPPMMVAYDMPIPFATVGRRSVSNVPAQALILMNDPFVVQQAEVWAGRVLASGEKGADERITGMYLQAFSRPPTGAELREGQAFVEQMGETYGAAKGKPAADERVWADYAHVLFNVKEFIFVR